MIVVRNVFRLKFGKAREALAVWKEGMAINKKLGMPEGRLLTDVTGQFYTLVFETTFPSLSAWEEVGKKVMGSEDFRNWYQKTQQYTESGYREIFSVVE
ncbi:MAG: hypothetical protein C5B54_11730 [Acidobacteria bacterium]|nr:MAG: hypothetical protein C5B54_11730 [Acidobacteriota bacterium]